MDTTGILRHRAHHLRHHGLHPRLVLALPRGIPDGVPHGWREEKAAHPPQLPAGRRLSRVRARRAAGQARRYLRCLPGGRPQGARKCSAGLRTLAAIRLPPKKASPPWHLAAALSRLCPEAPPNGKPQARLRNSSIWRAMVRGISSSGSVTLSLYEHFHPQHEDLAQDAWRRRSNTSGSAAPSGAGTAWRPPALLCVCGHDLPFTPPKNFQEYLPLLKASNIKAQKTFYEDLELCIEDSDDSPAMHLYLPLDASSPSSREALFWNVQLAEAGDLLAMHYLATLYAGTEPPTWSGPKCGTAGAWKPATGPAPPMISAALSVGSAPGRDRPEDRHLPDLLRL